MVVRGWGRERVLSASVAVLVVVGLVSAAFGTAAAQSATPAAGGDAIVVSHAQGETTVARNPETVLVFDLASVDTLDALGVTISGLPKSHLEGDLARFDSDEYIDLGTLFEPDFEAVAAAEPDLIIVANRSSTVYPELSGIGPTIDLTTSGTDPIADLTATATTLAAIFGKEAEAAELLAGINGQVDELRAAGASLGTGLVIMTSAGELTALAPGGIRGGLIYTTLGVTPPVEDVEEATHGEAISFEFLLEHNPDWLFVIDRDVATGEEGAAAEEILDNEIVRQTTAWQEGNVVYLNSYDWYIVFGGLSTTARMLGELQTALGV